jgi:hypothetical protein
VHVEFLVCGADIVSYGVYAYVHFRSGGKVTITFREEGEEMNLLRPQSIGVCGRRPYSLVLEDVDNLAGDLG